MVVFIIASYILLLGIGALLYALYRALRSVARWRPPYGPPIAGALAVAVVVGAGWGPYRLVYPSDAFYREEFESATSLPLPASARRLAGCSAWAMTAAIHEVSAEEWGALSRALRARSEPIGAVRSLCDPSLASSFVGEGFRLREIRRLVIVGLDDERRRVFWEVRWD